MRFIIRRRILDGAVFAAVLAALGALIFYPSESVKAASDGLELCANVIVPSLFPFFVLSSLVVSTGLADHLGVLLAPVMRPLFNVGGVCSAALVLGFVGGYPVGARTVISLYESGRCTKAEAERLLSFCNNSGPAFILGVVGTSIYSSSRIGLLLYLAHTLSSVITGILFRGWGAAARNKAPAIPVEREKKSLAAAFTGAVKGSFTSTLNICGFVIFFTVLIRLLLVTGVIPNAADGLAALFGPLGLSEEWAERLLTGVIELSSGVWTLRDAPGLTGSVAMAAFMLGWAGLSIHCQTLSFIGESDLTAKTYIIGKALHGAISAGLIFLLSRIFVFEAPAATYLAEQVDGLATLNFFSALTTSIAAVIGVCALLVTAVRYNKSRRAKQKPVHDGK